jgi:outer membrane lipoprotein-sorting protein
MHMRVNGHKAWIAAACLAASLGSAPAVIAATPDGLAVFTELAKRDAGFGDQKAEVIMTLKTKSGGENVRAMRIANLESRPGDFRSLLIFDKPLDVQGTSLLTHSFSKAADEQWIYLPAFNRAKKISDANKTAAFMGSEFSFEDINSINVQVPKYTYKLIGVETLAGAAAWKVERYPGDKHSGYKHQVAWIDTANYTIGKVEYYDRDDKKSKILTTTGYEKFQGKFWRPKEMRMENLDNGNVTVLAWSGYAFKNGLKDKDFEVAVLKRE